MVRRSSAKLFWMFLAPTVVGVVFLLLYFSFALRGRLALIEALRELNASVQADVDVRLGAVGMPRCFGLRYNDLVFVPLEAGAPGLFAGALDVCINPFDFLPGRSRGRFRLVFRTPAGDLTLTADHPRAAFLEHVAAFLNPGEDKKPLGAPPEGGQPPVVRIPLDEAKVPQAPLPRSSLRRRADAGLLPLVPHPSPSREGATKGGATPPRPLTPDAVLSLMKNYTLASGFTQIPGRWQIPPLWRTVVLPPPLGEGRESRDFWEIPGGGDDTAVLTLAFHSVDAGGLLGFLLRELVGLFPPELIAGLGEPHAAGQITGQVQLREWGGESAGERGRLSVQIAGLQVHVPGALPEQLAFEPVALRAHYENGQLAFSDWITLEGKDFRVAFKGQMSLFERNGRPRDLPAHLLVKITPRGQTSRWNRATIARFFACPTPDNAAAKDGTLQFELVGMTYDLHCAP